MFEPTFLLFFGKLKDSLSLQSLFTKPLQLCVPLSIQPVPFTHFYICHTNKVHLYMQEAKDKTKTDEIGAHLQDLNLAPMICQPNVLPSGNVT